MNEVDRLNFELAEAKRLLKWQSGYVHNLTMLLKEGEVEAEYMQFEINKFLGTKNKGDK